MSRRHPRGYAATDPASADPSLRGRTYAIPFEQVWSAALELAGGRLRGWSVTEHNDAEGSITGTTRSLAGAIHDVTIRIYLDDDAQTRVDATAQARKPLSNFGRSRRRLRRFFRALDRRLAQKPKHAQAKT